MSALISHLIDCFIRNQIIPRYLITLPKARWCGGHFKDSLSRGADTRACNLSVLTLYHPSWNGLPQIKKYNCFFINWPFLDFSIIFSCTKQPLIITQLNQKVDLSCKKLTSMTLKKSKSMLKTHFLYKFYTLFVLIGVY